MLKQSPEVFCKKRCSQEFFKIHRKTPGKRLRPATLLKESLARCFPVNFSKFVRTPFQQNTQYDCFCLWQHDLCETCYGPSKRYTYLYVHIRSFSGPHFPAFKLNTSRYEVFFRMQSEFEKYGPEKLRIRTLFTQ